MSKESEIKGTSRNVPQWAKITGVILLLLIPASVYYFGGTRNKPHDPVVKTKSVTNDPVVKSKPTTPDLQDKSESQGSNNPAFEEGEFIPEPGEKYWEVVIRASGSSADNSTTKTDIFELTGGRQRLDYTSTPIGARSGNSAISFFLVSMAQKDPSDDIWEWQEYGEATQKTPVASVTGGESGSVLVDRSGGIHYLIIKSTEASWNLELHQEQEAGR